MQKFYNYIVLIFIFIPFILSCQNTIRLKNQPAIDKNPPMSEKQQQVKIIPKIQENINGYAKIITFFTDNGKPIIGGGWGHECRFTHINAKGVYEVELFGLDGQPQHPQKHKGLCLSFICKDHFDKTKSLPIRLTIDPIIIHVAGAAKLGSYGQLQRVYDIDGNELVLNRDSNEGYKLFLVSPNKKVLAKYYLSKHATLRIGDEGYAYAYMKYSSKGELLEIKKYDIEGNLID